MRHFYEHLNDLLIPDFRLALFYVPFLLLVGRLSLYTKKKRLPLILILVWNSNVAFQYFIIDYTETWHGRTFKQ
jgi:hypothetical protein